MRSRRFPAPRRLRQAFILCVLATATFASHRRLQEARRAPGEEMQAILDQVLSPAELLSATLLGGLRPLAINILWIRVLEGFQERRFEDLPGLYTALEVLQGDQPLLYYLESNQMVFDIPRHLPSESEERRAWIRHGLEAIEKGIRRFPREILLLRQALWIYFFRFHPDRCPGDRAWFLSERPRDGNLVAFGQDPVQIARRAGERALQIDGHPVDVDLVLWEVLRLSYRLRGSDDLAANEPEEAKALLAHCQAAHAEVPGIEEILEAWRRQLEEEEKALREGQR